MIRIIKPCISALLVQLLIPTLVFGEQYRFYHSDPLGSNVLITDGSGQVVERMVHTPYGRIHAIVDDSGQSLEPTADTPRHQFTGQERDPESDLDAFPARHYDSSIGRFLSQDPIWVTDSDTAMQALNTSGHVMNGYAYTANRPTALIDPEGKIVWVPLVLGAANAAGVGLAFAEFAAAPSAATAAGLALEFVNPVPFAGKALKLGGRGVRALRGVTASGAPLRQADVLASKANLPALAGRGDARAPNIIAERGFEPVGANLDLVSANCGNRGFVCSSVDPEIARQFGHVAADQIDESTSYIYFFEPGSNALLADKVLTKTERRVAQIGGQQRIDNVGGIPAKSLIGAVANDVKTGKIDSTFLVNENLLKLRQKLGL